MLTLEAATAVQRKCLEVKEVVVNIDGIEFTATLSNVEIKYGGSVKDGIYRGEQLLKPLVDKITIEFTKGLNDTNGSI